MSKRFDNLLGDQDLAITRATEILDDPIQSQYVPLNQWIPIADGVHLIPAFLTELLKTLTEAEKGQFSLALAMSNACEGNSTLFWTTLYQESRSAYGKAIYTTARTYEYPIVAKELAAILPTEDIQPNPRNHYLGSN